MGAEVRAMGESQVVLCSVDLTLLALDTVIIVSVSVGGLSSSASAVMLKSVPLPDDGGWSNILARSAPSPLLILFGRRSAAGKRVISGRGSAARLLPSKPYFRRSISMTSLRYSSKLGFMSFAFSVGQPSSHALVPSSLIVQ